MQLGVERLGPVARRRLQPGHARGERGRTNSCNSDAPDAPKPCFRGCPTDRRSGSRRAASLPSSRISGSASACARWHWHSLEGSGAAARRGARSSGRRSGVRQRARQTGWVTPAGAFRWSHEIALATAHLWACHRRQLQLQTFRNAVGVNAGRLERLQPPQCGLHLGRRRWQIDAGDLDRPTACTSGRQPASSDSTMTRASSRSRGGRRIRFNPQGVGMAVGSAVTIAFEPGK